MRILLLGSIACVLLAHAHGAENSNPVVVRGGVPGNSPAAREEKPVPGGYLTFTVHKDGSFEAIRRSHVIQSNDPERGEYHRKGKVAPEHIEMFRARLAELGLFEVDTKKMETAMKNQDSLYFIADGGDYTLEASFGEKRFAYSRNAIPSYAHHYPDIRELQVLNASIQTYTAFGEMLFELGEKP